MESNGVITSATDLFKQMKPRMEKLEIEQLGGEVWMRELTGEEALIYERFKIDPGADEDDDKDGDAVLVDTVHLIAYSLCNEAGDRLLTTDEEILRLKRFPNSVITQMYLKALGLGKATKQEVEEAGED